eukprot:TRINITY_DN1196_c0_g1_i1.p1 TRINITY_DN1196_c0_g1~~TRINITY_DN1196_c0_g1_i1.p1  ORF type:complete len:346 (+),score=56.21 TRINITY_DN1196_c0_g1_i1:264-1301(+)
MEVDAELSMLWATTTVGITGLWAGWSLNSRLGMAWLVYPIGAIILLSLIGFVMVDCMVGHRRIRADRKRRKRVWLTPSRFAAACGMHPWKSRTELFLSMIGAKSEVGPNQQEAMDWGNKHEETAFEVYSSLRYEKVIEKPASTIRHPHLPWLRGIADGIVVDEEGAREGILEIKCRFSRDGDQQNTLPHQSLVPMYYYIPQIQGYMELYDAEYCDLMSFTLKGSNIFRVRRDRVYWAKMQTALEEFLGYVKRAKTEYGPEELLSMAEVVRSSSVDGGGKARVGSARTRPVRRRILEGSSPPPLPPPPPPPSSSRSIPESFLPPVEHRYTGYLQEASRIVEWRAAT